MEERLRFVAQLLDGEPMAGMYQAKMALPRGLEPLFSP